MNRPTPATMPGTMSGIRKPSSSGPRRFTRGRTGPTISAPAMHATEVMSASTRLSRIGPPTKKLLP